LTFGLFYFLPINIGIRASSLIPMGCCEPAITNYDMVEKTIEVRSSLDSWSSSLRFG